MVGKVWSVSVVATSLVGKRLTDHSVIGKGLVGNDVVGIGVLGNGLVSSVLLVNSVTDNALGNSDCAFSGSNDPPQVTQGTLVLVLV